MTMVFLSRPVSASAAVMLPMASSSSSAMPQMVARFSSPPVALFAMQRAMSSGEASRGTCVSWKAT
jgi:hypothetical protein